MKLRPSYAAGLAALSLAACGGGSGGSTDSSSAQSPARGQAEAPAPGPSCRAARPLEELPPGQTAVAESAFDTDFTGLAPGWQVNQWGGAAWDAGRSTDARNSSGAQRFRVNNRGTGDAQLFYDFAFKANKMYRAVFYIKKIKQDSEEADTLVDVMFRRHKPYDVATKTTVSVGGNWQRVEIEGYYRWTDRGALRIAVQDVGKDILIDSMTLIELSDELRAAPTPLPNSDPLATPVSTLVSCSDFSGSPDSKFGWGWKVNDWWVDGQPRPKYLAEVRTDGGMGGYQRFQLESKGSGDAHLIYGYPFRVGRTYRVEMLARTSGDGNPAVTLGIRRERKDSHPMLIEKTFRPGPSFQRIGFEVAIDGREPKTLRLALDQPGTLDIDEVRIYEVNKNDVKPASKSVAPDLLFGVHYTLLPEHALDAGVNASVLRLWDTTTTWKDLEDAGPGQWSTKIFRDRLQWVYLARATSKGQKVLMTLGQTPGWAQPKGPQYAPERFDDWKNYVRHLKEHPNLAGKIHYWEVWNEADYNLFYKDSVANLLRLTETTREALGNDAVIISPSFTVSTGLARLESFLAAGGHNHVDKIGYHFYYNPVRPENIVAPIANVRAVLKSHGVTKPIWNTEGGPYCSVSDTATGGCVADNPTENEHWASMPRALMVMWSQGIENFNYYQYEGKRNFSPVSALARPDSGWRPLTTAGKAYNKIREWLTGAQLEDAYEVRDNPTDENLVYVFKLKRGTRSFAILWSTNEGRKVQLPATWGFTTATPLNGSQAPISGQQLTLGVVPVLLQ
ncbi:hypothetical protein OOT46_10660 [Aquabacterium sp. A7-Y]|uniref:hypothetical protein n=1 Tax=Aquabacterium sp. A7-Y TaxID=1349605 RepID=UPI00223E7FF7|nr:hypothetical protein [Aquabacterium sp. A7-Y]MCW7538302.1 hypothetical protein [Aquabacterium sp. A7-Y]